LNRTERKKAPVTSALIKGRKVRFGKRMICSIRPDIASTPSVSSQLLRAKPR
jgi:hypothetical protein